MVVGTAVVGGRLNCSSSGRFCSSSGRFCSSSGSAVVVVGSAVVVVGSVVFCAFTCTSLLVIMVRTAVKMIAFCHFNKYIFPILAVINKTYCNTQNTFQVFYASFNLTLMS